MWRSSTPTTSLINRWCEIVVMSSALSAISAGRVTVVGVSANCWRHVVSYGCHRVESLVHYVTVCEITWLWRLGRPGGSAIMKFDCQLTWDGRVGWSYCTFINYLTLFYCFMCYYICYEKLFVSNNYTKGGGTIVTFTFDYKRLQTHVRHNLTKLSFNKRDLE